MSTNCQTKNVIFSDIKADLNWSFNDVKRTDILKNTHSYHRYPAKFIPQIVEKLILEYTKESDIVCDPFGGCGTTLVESKLHGRKSVGLDINPVATFISKVKLKPINPDLIDKYEKKYLSYLKENYKIKDDYSERLNYWFDKRTLNKLDRIYTAINKLENRDVRMFFLCAFSHILKNCSRWLMKSIKPTQDKVKTIPSPYDTFISQIHRNKKKNKQFYENLKSSNNLKVPARVLKNDSTKKLPIKSNSIDLIVTSPPYVTSYEYADLHQLTLLWFGEDKKYFKNWSNYSKDFLSFRKKFIGTSYKYKKRDELNSVIGEDIVKKLSEKHKKTSVEVANYFFDMNLAFKEMYRIIKKDKEVCIIIGNTNLKGVEILNAEVAVEQMESIGFKKNKVIKREVLNKMITPWRDKKTGKFTSLSNPNRKLAYEYEYILIMQK